MKHCHLHNILHAGTACPMCREDAARNLPPKWYSALERKLIANKVWVYILLALCFFFGIPYFAPPPRLDDQLLEGIND